MVLDISGTNIIRNKKGPQFLASQIVLISLLQSFFLQHYAIDIHTDHQ